MQKALIVRTAIDASGSAWSHEVDRAAEPKPGLLPSLLAEGWHVVHTCPMPSELDNCCLVVIEGPPKPAESGHMRQDIPLAEANKPSDWFRLHHTHPRERTRATWDGETFGLKVFGIPPANEPPTA